MVQLPVLPLIDPASRWISGHYCDEFAEAHIKELVVREAVGAAIPLAGVGCAIEREPLARLAALHDGRPFAGASLTEDYELGLRLGALGLKTMFVRIPATPGEPGVVASRGHFPATLGAAVRQKARWIGGIALAGWDRLGWRGGLGERWMRMRDRRGPLAALLLVAAYVAALLWSPAVARRGARRAGPGAARSGARDPACGSTAGCSAGGSSMRACFTASAYGWARACCRSRGWWSATSSRCSPRRAPSRSTSAAARKRWDKTRHIFPGGDSPNEPVAPLPRARGVGWAGSARRRSARCPGAGDVSASGRSEAKPAPPPDRPDAISRRSSPPRPMIRRGCRRMTAAPGMAAAAYPVALRPVAVPVYYAAASLRRRRPLPPPRQLPRASFPSRRPHFYSPNPGARRVAPLSRIRVVEFAGRSAARSVVVARAEHPRRASTARPAAADRLGDAARAAGGRAAGPIAGNGGTARRQPGRARG